MQVEQTGGDDSRTMCTAFWRQHPLCAAFGIRTNVMSRRFVRLLARRCGPPLDTHAVEQRAPHVTCFLPQCPAAAVLGGCTTRGCIHGHHTGAHQGHSAMLRVAATPHTLPKYCPLLWDVGCRRQQMMGKGSCRTARSAHETMC